MLSTTFAFVALIIRLGEAQAEAIAKRFLSSIHSLIVFSVTACLNAAVIAVKTLDEILCLESCASVGLSLEPDETIQFAERMANIKLKRSTKVKLNSISVGGTDEKQNKT